MAAWLLAILVAISFQVLKETTAEPKIQDSRSSIYHDTKSGWCSKEKSCTQDHHLYTNGRSGPFDSMVDDLHSKLRDAEFELKNTNNYPQHYDPKFREEFDFIVVGAGSAGSVVANRLSEVEGWRVLLVEAGGVPPAASEVPALAVTLQGSDIDWQYETDREEENCLGMVENRCKWPRGKVLGGSSTINYMMHTRGHPKDFDGWADAGNKGWSYQEVLPYFKKSEDINDPSVWVTERAQKYHNKGGLLSIDSWPDNKDMQTAITVLADGLRDLGYPYNPDINGNNATGFTKMQGTLRDQRRCSTAKAFLSSAKDRPNLFLSKHTLVTRILIELKSKRAYGVILLTKEGKSIEVHAKKEVTVSAGAINSPKLLMLSGIGPKDHLYSLGIPVVEDLPVGENLQDHPLMASVVLTTNFSFSVSPPDFGDMFKFLTKQASRMSSFSSFPYAAYINTVPNVDHPDIELLQQHTPKNNTELMRGILHLFNFKESIIEEYITINENAYAIIMLGSLMRPYSRGRISLQNTDPNIPPKIVAGTFTDKRDIDTYLRTYEFISRLVETEPLKRVDAKLHEVRVSDCENHQTGSSAYRECALRHLTGTTYHYSGTCKMGPPGDPTAVVDPSLRVQGVEGLRVVDASVMPTIVSAHINAAVIMIGEKAADIIKHHWKHGS